MASIGSVIITTISFYCAEPWEPPFTQPGAATGDEPVVSIHEVLHHRECLQLRAVAFWSGQQCRRGDQKGWGGPSGLGVCFIFPHCVTEPPPAPLEHRPGITQPSPFALGVGCFYKCGINAAQELFPFPFSSPIPPSLKHPQLSHPLGLQGWGGGSDPAQILPHREQPLCYPLHLRPGAPRCPSLVVLG